MLDDFKTELKRLGMRRIQQEEMRRHSVALVLDDKDDDQEVEFADTLNTRSPASNGTRLSTSNSPNGRLRHDSMGNSCANKRGAAKAQTGKGGIKISQLPGLKKLGFAKRKEKIDSEAGDLEKHHPPPSNPVSQNEDPSSSTERVNHMRGSLGAFEFHTKPAGL
jgi:hypothetical protein